MFALPKHLADNASRSLRHEVFLGTYSDPPTAFVLDGLNLTQTFPKKVCLTLIPTYRR